MLIQVNDDAAPVFGADTPSSFEMHLHLGLTGADRADLHEVAALDIGRLNLIPRKFRRRAMLKIIPIVQAPYPALRRRTST